MQVLGARGYSQDRLVEYCWRRARGWQIAGGSLEMMTTRIAEGVSPGEWVVLSPAELREDQRVNPSLSD
jgi:hypothetical protein